MKTAAAYIRVSTDDQLEYSPDSQLKIIRDYAKTHDMILPDEYVFREEDGISGRKAEKRPAFMRMIGTAKQTPKPFDCILIWKFSRFARNRQDSIVYKTLLRKQLGIDVISVSENVGDDKMSILIEALIEAMDEYYSVNLSEEVKRGMAEKASRGGVVAGAPFGYMVRDGVYVPDPQKAPIVQMAFDSYLAGITLFELARKLNNMGVTSRRGNPMENRTIEYILRNPAYIGKIRWNPNGKTTRYQGANEILSDGKHEALVSLETWNKVQNKLDAQKRMYPYKAKPTARQEFILRGLVRCSSCGSTLVMCVQNVGLQCHSYAKGSCKVSHYITLAEITKTSLSLIDQLLDDKNFTLLHKSHLKSEDATDHLIAKEYVKLERVKAAYEAGVDSLEEYRGNKEKINAEIHRLKAILPKPSRSEEKIKEAFARKHKGTMKKLRDPNIPEAEKNRLLRSFVDHITFDRASTGLNVVFYD